MEVLKTHQKGYHRRYNGAACTECPWKRNDRPHDVIDHLRSVHDIYPAGDPNAFSTALNHLKRKSGRLLRRLLAEDRATLGTLGGPQITTMIRDSWNQVRLAREVRRLRMQIKRLPGWEDVVFPQRGDRIAREAF